MPLELSYVAIEDEKKERMLFKILPRNGRHFRFYRRRNAFLKVSKRDIERYFRVTGRKVLPVSLVIDWRNSLKQTSPSNRDADPSSSKRMIVAADRDDEDRFNDDIGEESTGGLLPPKLPSDPFLTRPTTSLSSPSSSKAASATSTTTRTTTRTTTSPSSFFSNVTSIANTWTASDPELTKTAMPEASSTDTDSVDTTLTQSTAPLLERRPSAVDDRVEMAENEIKSLLSEIKALVLAKAQSYRRGEAHVDEAENDDNEDADSREDDLKIGTCFKQISLAAQRVMSLDESCLDELLKTCNILRFKRPKLATRVAHRALWAKNTIEEKIPNGEGEVGVAGRGPFIVRQKSFNALRPLSPCAHRLHALEIPVDHPTRWSYSSQGSSANSFRWSVGSEEADFSPLMSLLPIASKSRLRHGSIDSTPLPTDDLSLGSFDADLDFGFFDIDWSPHFLAEPVNRSDLPPPTPSRKSSFITAPLSPRSPRISLTDPRRIGFDVAELVDVSAGQLWFDPGFSFSLCHED